MIALIAIVGFMVSGSLANLDANGVCQLMVDGTKLRNVDHCDRYYVCKNSKATEYSCPNGYQYNKDRQDCVTPKESTCQIVPDDITQICDGKPNGSWQADPYSCDGFYYCNGKQALQGACPTGQHFKPDTQECVHAGKDFECNKGTLDTEDKNFICSMVPSNQYFGVSTNCQKWAICKNGIYDSGNCGDNTYFDLSDGLCGYDKTCSQLSSNIKPEDPEIENEPPAIDGDCTVEQQGKYKTDGTCSGFYWCSYTKQWQRGICSNGRAFKVDKCVPRSQKSCDSCQNTKGVYTWVNDPSDCKKYYYCKDNKIEARDTCSSGEFDVILQRCVTKLNKDYAACGTTPECDESGEACKPESCVDENDKSCETENCEDGSCECNGKDCNTIPCKDGSGEDCECAEENCNPVCDENGTTDLCKCNETKDGCALDEKTVCKIDGDENDCKCNEEANCKPICHEEGIDGGLCKCNETKDGCERKCKNKDGNPCICAAGAEEGTENCKE